MTLDQILDVWYQTDPDYFDLILPMNSWTLADAAWNRFMMALEDGNSLHSAFADVLDDDQALQLYNYLVPQYA